MHRVCLNNRAQVIFLMTATACCIYMHWVYSNNRANRYCLLYMHRDECTRTTGPRTFSSWPLLSVVHVLSWVYSNNRAQDIFLMTATDCCTCTECTWKTGPRTGHFPHDRYWLLYMHWVYLKNRAQDIFLMTATTCCTCTECTWTTGPRTFSSWPLLSVVHALQHPMYYL
jgi:hypothetical protein